MGRRVLVRPQALGIASQVWVCRCEKGMTSKVCVLCEGKDLLWACRICAAVGGLAACGDRYNTRRCSRCVLRHFSASFTPALLDLSGRRNTTLDISERWSERKHVNNNSFPRHPPTRNSSADIYFPPHISHPHQRPMVSPLPTRKIQHPYRYTPHEQTNPFRSPPRLFRSQYLLHKRSPAAATTISRLL